MAGDSCRRIVVDDYYKQRAALSSANNILFCNSQPAPELLLECNNSNNKSIATNKTNKQQSELITTLHKYNAIELENRIVEQKCNTLNKTKQKQQEFEANISEEQQQQQDYATFKNLKEKEEEEKEKNAKERATTQSTTATTTTLCAAVTRAVNWFAFNVGEQLNANRQHRVVVNSRADSKLDSKVNCNLKSARANKICTQTANKTVACDNDERIDKRSASKSLLLLLQQENGGCESNSSGSARVCCESNRVVVAAERPAGCASRLLAGSLTANNWRHNFALTAAKKKVKRQGESEEKIKNAAQVFDSRVECNLRGEKRVAHLNCIDELSNKAKVVVENNKEDNSGSAFSRVLACETDTIASSSCGKQLPLARATHKCNKKLKQRQTSKSILCRKEEKLEQNQTSSKCKKKKKQDRSKSAVIAINNNNNDDYDYDDGYVEWRKKFASDFFFKRKLSSCSAHKSTLANLSSQSEFTLVNKQQNFYAQNYNNKKEDLNINARKFDNASLNSIKACIACGPVDTISDNCSHSSACNSYDSFTSSDATSNNERQIIKLASLLPSTSISTITSNKYSGKCNDTCGNNGLKYYQNHKLVNTNYNVAKLERNSRACRQFKSVQLPLSRRKLTNQSFNQQQQQLHQHNPQASIGISISSNSSRSSNSGSSNSSSSSSGSVSNGRCRRCLLSCKAKFARLELMLSSKQQAAKRANSRFWQASYLNDGVESDAKLAEMPPIAHCSPLYMMSQSSQKTINDNETEERTIDNNNKRDNNEQEFQELPEEHDTRVNIVLSNTDASSKLSIKKRGHWDKNIEFLLAVIGFAVDLGNIWRFPYICYKNGGGAFLIPYTLIFLTGGLPIFYLEMLAGQYFASGCLTVWRRICPLAKGVGYAMCILNFFTGLFYNTIISWAVYFFIQSFSFSELPWTTCTNSWNNMTLCRTIAQRKAMMTSNAYHLTMSDETFTSPAKEFFDRQVLQVHLSSGIEDLGSIRLPLATYLAVVFVFVYFAIWRGVKSTGKAVWVTALLPYFVLIPLLIRGIFLDGAWIGIKYYLMPDWNKLRMVSVWVDAATQIFFSLGPGFGTLLALSSYNKFNHDCRRDAIIAASVNYFASFISGFVIFAVLGYMSTMQNVDISQVATEGPGLVFQVYPEGLATMRAASFWSVLFFIMVITLGIDSTFGGLESVITGLCDEYPRTLRANRGLFIGILIFVIYLCSLPTTTYGGNYVINVIEAYGTSLSLLLIVLIETVIICWVYGVDKFSLKVSRMSGGKLPGLYWRFCWKYVSPTILLLIFVGALYKEADKYKELRYNSTYVYPTWALALGWLMTASSVSCIPIYAAYKLFTLQGTFRQRLISSLTPVDEDEDDDNGREDEGQRNVELIDNRFAINTDLTLALDSKGTSSDVILDKGRMAKRPITTSTTTTATTTVTTTTTSSTTKAQQSLI